MRTKVILHGALARDVGRAEWEFEIETPIEAIRAIEANSGKILAHFYANMETEYRFLLDGKEISNISDLSLGEVGEMNILPVLKGAGGAGAALLIIGIVILAIVAWEVLPAALPAALGGSGVALSASASFFLTVGLALTLGGIAQLIAPTNKSDNNSVDSRPSYLYNGAVNTYQQGNPVPFGAGGPFLTGSQIISVGIRSIDIIDPYTLLTNPDFPLTITVAS